MQTLIQSTIFCKGIERYIEYYNGRTHQTTKQAPKQRYEASIQQAAWTEWARSNPGCSPIFLARPLYGGGEGLDRKTEEEHSPGKRWKLNLTNRPFGPKNGEYYNLPVNMQMLKVKSFTC